MSSFRKLSVEELLKELDKYKFKQLHVHHTWKPTHRSFKGNNHIAMQQSMYNYHVNTNKWSDIGQHLTLFPDGAWLTGRPFNITPASIKDWNTGALAVEMIGNFDKIGSLPYNDLGYDELEGEQKKQILLLMKYFIDKYGENSIKFHKEGPGVGKTCPGTSLNKYAMIQEVKDMSSKVDKPIIAVDKLYKVQVGAYSIKENAETLLKDLKSKGFRGFITEEELKEVPKKRLVSYKGPNNSEIIEIDPLDLYIEINKSAGDSVKGDFINGSFYDMKSMKSISTLVSNGKVLAEHLPHDNVKRGTFVVYKNGTVSVEMIDFISKYPKLKDIKFAIGGFNILPAGKTIREQLKSEWFDFNVVGYKTWRSMIGYSKKVNKVLIVMVPDTDAEQGQALMDKLGCDIAVGLDSGGSTCGRFNNNTIRTTTRSLHNIIRW